MESHQFRNEQEKDKKQLLFNVQTALNKLIAKRRKEFEALWVKYCKVRRSIENLHHKENHRLEYLEKKKLEAMKVQKNDRSLKVRHPRLENVEKVSNLLTLEALQHEKNEQLRSKR